MKLKHLKFVLLAILCLFLVACSESRANKKYDDAQHALKSDNFDQAENILKEIIKDFPDTKSAVASRKLLIDANSAKIKADMASYYAEFAPKFEQLKGANVSINSTTRQDSTQYSFSGNIEEFKNKFAELTAIKPKTTEIQLIHQKICTGISAAITIVEETTKFSGEPDQATMAKLTQVGNNANSVEKELKVLLERVYTVHKSNEAKQLMQDLELSPHPN